MPPERYTASDRPDLAAAAGRVVERYHQRVRPATRAHGGGVTAVIRLLANGETEARLLAAVEQFASFADEQNRRADMRPSAASFFRPDGQWDDMLRAAMPSPVPSTAERLRTMVDSAVVEAYADLHDAARGQRVLGARPGRGLHADGSVDLEWVEEKLADTLRRARAKGLQPTWRGEGATWEQVAGLTRAEQARAAARVAAGGAA